MRADERPRSEWQSAPSEESGQRAANSLQLGLQIIAAPPPFCLIMSRRDGGNSRLNCNKNPIGSGSRSCSFKLMGFGRIVGSFGYSILNKPTACLSCAFFLFLWFVAANLDTRTAGQFATREPVVNLQRHCHRRSLTFAITRKGSARGPTNSDGIIRNELGAQDKLRGARREFH